MSKVYLVNNLKFSIYADKILLITLNIEHIDSLDLIEHFNLLNRNKKKKKKQEGKKDKEEEKKVKQKKIMNNIIKKKMIIMKIMKKKINNPSCKNLIKFKEKRIFS